MARRLREISDDQPKAKINRDSLGQYRRIFSYALPYLNWLIIGAVALIITSVINLLIPLLLRNVVDLIFTGDITTSIQEGTRQLNRIVLLMLSAFVIQAIFSFINRIALAIVGESAVVDIRKDLFSHLQKLSLTWFADNRTGEIISRLTNDTYTVQFAVSGNLINLLRQAVLLLGAIGFLFYLNLRLTLIIIIAIPLMSLTIVGLGRMIRRAAKEVQDRIADSSNVVEETVSGIRIVKSFAREPYEIGRYTQAVKEIFDAAMRQAKISATLAPIIGLIAFSCITAVFWFGARQVLFSEQSPGDLIAYLTYTMIVSSQVANLAGLVTQFQTALGATERLFDLLDTPPTITDSPSATPLPPIQGNIQFETVGFNYTDRVSVLRDISFEAQAGEVVALVGPSGAGKSTLINLIPRFYDVQEGCIKIDSYDIRDITIPSLRDQIGIVPQETILFSDTVRNNIRYGRLDATDEEITLAAKAANADGFITEDLPDGYDTLVGERGIKLSGGQRQRIAIARAMLKNPRILILDEATSSLDSESERLVQDALEILMQGRTSFVIAHRLSTIINADKILVLDKGHLVAQGTHDELLANPDSVYTRLHNIQFQ